MNTNNQSLPTHEADKLIEIYVRVPTWMRDELNVRAIRAHMKRDHYIRSLFLAAWDNKKES